MDLVEEIVPNFLPSLFFTFSRKRCEANAKEAGERYNLINDAERKAVREIIEQQAARIRYLTSGASMTLSRCSSAASPITMPVCCR